MGTIGSMLRGIILALVVGCIVAIVGALAALFACSGGCSWAEPASDLVVAPTPGLPGVLMAVLLGGLLFLGLVIALTPRDPVVSLAAVFALLIGVDSFLYWLPRPAASEAEPAEPEPTSPEPTSPPLTTLRGEGQPELESCGAGMFRDGRTCTPCEREERVADAPLLTLEGVSTGAYWQYAREAEVVSASTGSVMSVDALARQLADQNALCDAKALLVYGSASSDGERSRNVVRAQARASNLASALQKACRGRSDGLTIFALSLGQAEAPQDVAEDRLVGLSIIRPAPGVEPDGEKILNELGYALNEGQRVAPLLARRDRFPHPWQGPSGAIQGIPLKARPMRTVVTRTPGAPSSCEAPELVETGLDAAPFLRQ